MTGPTPIFPDLDGASVFITGGGSGIGAALTEGFVGQGAKVAFIDLIDAGDFVADLAARYGTPPIFIRGDITDTEVLRAAIAQATEVHGPVSVLVNNAANDQRHRIDEVTPEFWDQMIAVNLKAYYFAVQAVVPGMRVAGGGAIVNFSSTSYMIGSPDLAVYASANAGITGMTRSLARELGGDHIRVNAVAPGWVLTEKQKRLWVTEEALKAHLARQCLPDRLGPEDMVGGVLFLASAASSAMTGQVIVLDGGVVVTG